MNCLESLCCSSFYSNTVNGMLIYFAFLSLILPKSYEAFKFELLRQGICEPV